MKTTPRPAARPRSPLQRFLRSALTVFALTTILPMCTDLTGPGKANGDIQLTVMQPTVDLAAGAAILVVGDTIHPQVDIKIGGISTTRGRFSVRSLNNRTDVVKIDSGTVITVVGRGTDTLIVSVVGVTINPALSNSTADTLPIVAKPANNFINVASDSTTLKSINQTASLRAVSKGKNGEPVAGASVVWSSSDSAIVDIVPTVIGGADSSVVLVKAKAPGTATITALFEGVDAKTQDIVVAPVVDSYQFAVAPGSNPATPAGGPITQYTFKSKNEVVRLVATPLDKLGTAVANAPAPTFSTNLQGRLTFDPATGLLTSVDNTVGLSTPPTIGIGSSVLTLLVVQEAKAITIQGARTVAIAAPTLGIKMSAVALDSLGNALTSGSPTWSSSDQTVATIDDQGQVSTFIKGTSTIGVRRDGATDAVTLNVGQDPATLTLTPKPMTIASIGATSQATAKTFDAAGTQLTGQAINWTTTNAAVATVNGSGVVTAAGVGSARIAATTAVGGATDTLNVAVTNNPATVSIVPSTITIASIGDTLSPAIDFRNAQNASLPRNSVTWSTLDQTIARPTLDGFGGVIAVAKGETQIIARSADGAADTVGVIVTNAPASVVMNRTNDALTSIATAGTGVLGVSALQYAADVFNGRGALIQGAQLSAEPVTWRSTNPAVASVNTAGLVTALSVGSTSIIAEIGGSTTGLRADTATLTITNDAVGMTVTPNSANITSVGRTQQLTASATNSAGGVINGQSFNWATSDASIATVDGAGLVTAVGTGTVTITASIPSTAISAPATITVTNLPTTIDITSSDTTLASVGDSFTPGFNFRNAVNTALPITSAVWTSDDPLIASVTSSGVVTAVGPGQTKIRATNASNAAIRDSLLVTVSNAAATMTLNPGTTQTLTSLGQTLTISATVKNLAGQPISNPNVTWSVVEGDATVVSVATSGVATGLVTAVSNGTRTIRATSGSVTTDLTVVVGQVISATQSTVSASPTSIPADGATQTTITVQLKDANGNIYVLNNPVMAITPSTGTLGTINNNGNGNYTATLTPPTTSGSAVVTVAAGAVSLSNSAIVTLTPTAATGYLVTSSNFTPVASTSVTITAQLKDVNGNNVSTAGKQITWTATNGGSFSPSNLTTTDVNGRSTVTFTTASGATTHFVTATDNSGPPLSGTTAAITTTSGAGTQFSVSSSNSAPVAGTQVTLTAQLQDANGNPVAQNGVGIVWGQSGTPGGTFGATTATGPNGSTSITFTTPTTAGASVNISATGTGIAAANLATISVVPATPTANAASAITPTGFTANWTAANGASGYRLDVASDVAFSSLVVADQAIGATTSQAVGGLSAGTTYFYRIRAANATDRSSNSNVITVTTTPSAPVIDAIASGDQQLSVSFTPASGGSFAVTSYEYSTDNGATFKARTTGTIGSPLVITELSSAATALTNGTTYQVRIRALSAVGTGATSAAGSGTPAATPGAPTALTATFGDGQVALTWTAPASTGGSALTDYVVQFSDNGGTSWQTFSDAVSTTTSTTVTGLTNGTLYTFRVAAANAAGTGSFSATTSETPRTTPAAPTLESITAGDQQLSVIFTAANSGGSTITTYQYSTDNGATWKTRATGSTASPLLITQISGAATALVNGTSYTVRVRAINAVGNGAASNSVAATPAALPGTPAAPSVTGFGDGQVSLSWIAPATGGSAITDYVIQFSGNGGASWQTFNDAASATTTTTVTGLTNGTAYVFRVAAVNVVGTGSFSAASASETPRIVPAAPTIDAITPSDQALSVTFTGASNGGSAITTYQYSTDGGTTFKARTSGTTASPIVITELSGAVTPLVNGTSYNVIIRAVNAVGNGASSNSVAATPAGTPGTPAAPSITGFGDGQVSISWIAPASGGSAITDYTVQFSSNAGASWTTFNDAVSTTASATVTGLTNGTAYVFRIAAVNAIGTGAFSTSSASETPRTTPSAATIDAIAPSDQSLSIAFTAGNNGGSAITTYQYSTDGGATFKTRATGTTASPIVITQVSNAATALVNGTSYNVIIRAVNAVGNGASSNTVAAVPATTPNAPTALTPAFGNGQVGLTWTAPAVTGGAAISDYVVQFSDNGGSSWQTFNDAVATTTSATVTGLTNGTLYTFRVAALNTAGTGAFSATATETPRTTPAAPTIDAIASSDQALSVAFTAANNGGAAITTYQYSTDNGATFKTRTTGTTASPIVITELSGAVTPLTNGTSYNVVIRAVNSVGNGASSNAVAATPAGTPAVPAAPGVTGFGDGQVSLSWTAPATGGSPIIDYAVQFSGNGGASWTTFNDGVATATTTTVTGLTNGIAYVFRVAGVNATGTGTFSAASASETPRTTPSAPTIDAITPSDQALSVAFTSASNGGSAITTYQYSTDGGVTFKARTAGTTASPIVITQVSSAATSLVNGTSYDVIIRAVNAVGNGASSNQVTATAAGVPSTPAAPTVTGFGDSQVSLSWTAPATGGSAISDYTIQFSANGGASWQTFSDAVSTTAATTVTGLTNGTAYVFRVAAVNAIGTGSFSAASASETPRTNPSTPTINTITSGNQTLSVDFSAASNGGSAVTTYQYSTDNGATFKARTTGTTASPIVITELSSAVTALANGTGYSVIIRAVNGVGNSANSNTVVATPATTPNAPTALTPTFGNAQVALAWTAPGVTGGASLTDYQVQFSDNGGSSWQTFNDAVSTTTSATVTGLTNGVLYTFRVAAINSAGTGAFSATTTATPGAVPDAPTNLSATAGNAQVALSWTAPASNGRAITDYLVEYDGGSGFTAFAHSASTATSITVTGLTNGTAYTFRVSAINAIGTGAASATTTTTPATAPSAPAAPTITGFGDSQVSLSWTAPATGGAAITDYAIQFSSNGGASWTTFNDAVSTTASTTVTGLTNGTAYLFRVAAVNVVGTGTFSAASASETPRTTPAAPTIDAITPSNQMLSVAFTAGATGGSAITTYQYSTDGGTTFKTRTTGTTASPIVISELSSAVTALTNGSTYNVIIRAVNAIGNGASSNTVVASPASVPGTPAAPSVTGFGDSQVSLSWTAPATGGSAITDYTVQFSGNGGASWQTFSDAVSTTASTTVTGLTNGTTYVFRVAAVNAIGTGAFSAASASETPRVVPLAPTIDAITPSNQQLSVAFTAGGTGGSAITTYEYSTDGGSTFKTRTAGSTASPLVITQISSAATALVNGTSYNVIIRAVNAVGSGASSNTVAAVPATTPDAPTALTPTFGDAQVALSWTAPAVTGGAAISDYVVQFSDNGGSSWQTFNDAVSTTTTATVTGLTDGTVYTFRVAAVNTAGTGAFSATTTETPRTTPAAPTIDAITPSNQTLSVAFTAGSTGGSAITTYQYSTDGGTSFKTRTTGTTASPLVITEQSGAVTPLVNGTSYNVIIRALNAVGTGASSNTVAASPATVPGTPAAPSVTGFGDSQVSLSWTAPATGGSAITDYTIQFSSNAGASWQTFSDAVSTTASTTVTGLTNGTTYVFRVAAVNAIGTGSFSAASASETPRVVPLAPTIDAITPSNQQLSVAFTPGSNGGSAITTYEYSTNGGTTFKTRTTGITASPLVITELSTGATALTNGTSYSVIIRAVNAVGSGASSNTVAAVPATAPDAPTALTPTFGDAQVALSWTAPAVTGGAAIADYVVQFSDNGGSSWQTFADAVSTTASATVTGLTNGTLYTFRVAAVNSIGTGAFSSTATATPAAVPDAPTNLSATAGSAQVALTWTAPASNGRAITDYFVEFNGGSGFTTFAHGASTATAITVTGLTNGTSYTFRVSAINSIGTSAASATTTATPATVPSAPAAPSVTGFGDSQVSLSWTAPAAGGSAITDYTVQFSGNGGASWQTFTDAVSTTTTATVTGLTNGTAYLFRVAAVNVVGTGAFSTASASETPRVVPLAPTIDAITPSNQQLSVAFTAGANGGSAITTYQYSTDGGASFKTRTTGTTASPIVITELSSAVTAPANGTSYNVIIRAVNAVGNGASSNTVAATPATTPNAPTALTPTFGNGQVALSWTAPAVTGGAAVTDYVVQFSDNGGSSWQTFNDAVSSATTTTVTGLTNGTVYTFRVAAVNTAGTGGFSATTTETPRTTPAAPTIDAITPTNQTLSVAFTAGASGGSAITGYEYSTDGGTSFKARTTGTTASPIVITELSSAVTPLTNGTSYSVIIRALNAVGTGASSNTVAASPASVPGTPAAPSVTGFGDSQVSLSWTAPTTGGSAITDYTIQFSSNGGASWQTFSDAVSTTASTTVTGLTNGTTYVFRVAAVNAIGTGSFSAASASETPRVVPLAPIIDAITPSNQQLSVAFTPGNNGGSAITTYEYSTNGGTNFKTRTTGTTASPLVITELSTGATALTNGTSYNVVIRAVNAVGSGASSNTVAAVPATTPDAPTALTPTFGDAQVALSWTAPAVTGGAAITDYVVQFSDNGGSSWQTFNDLVTATTGATVTGLTNGTLYSFRVAAVNPAGTGSFTSAATATPGALPDAPTNLSATAGNGQVALTWTAPASNGRSITNYLVELDGGGGFSTFAHGASTATAITVTGLTNGTAYTFRVSAINSIGTGAASSTTTATPATVPSAPAAPSITGHGDGSVDISWTAPATGGTAITDYVVQFSGNGGLTWTTFEDGTGASTTASVTALTNGTAYVFRVAASNVLGTGAFSAASTSEIPRTNPSAPTIDAVTPSDGTLSVAFTAAGDGGSAITTYRYSTDGGTTFKTRTTGSTASPIVITQISSAATALSNGTSYDVIIQAVNGVGNSANSNQITGTPATVPTAPGAPSITGFGDGQVSLSWTAPATGGSPLTDYTIQFSDNGGSSWQTFNHVASTTAAAIVTGLTNGTSYIFRVAAVNAIGTSAFSSASLAETPRTTPSAPTIDAITPSNQALSVAFTAGATGGTAITSYRYSTDGGATFKTRTSGSTASPIVIIEISSAATALTNGSTYNVIIQAVNAVGTGASSNTVVATPATVPDAPAITTITPAHQQLSVAFTAPVSNGGSAVTDYQYSTDNGITWKSAASTATPIVITQQSDAATTLANGTAYTVRLRAVNAQGAGPASPAVTETPGFTITGTIVDGSNGNAPLAGVTVTATGGHSQVVTTNASGVYTLNGIPNGATGIVITPTKANYVFTPATVNNVTASVTGQDFTATAVYTISGTIVDGSNGNAALSGVTVTATGGHSQVVTTDASGIYTLTGVLHNATGIVVTPTKTGYSFSPANRTVNTVTSNVTGQDFTATDIQAPTIVNVSSLKPDGTYTTGAIIDVNVLFSEPVNVSGGTPTLLLETGTTDRAATYLSGSGSSTLVFRYTVQPGDVSSDLDYQSTSALSLNSALIQDAALNSANLTLASPAASGSLGANNAIVIDAQSPSILAMNGPANGTYIVGQNLNFTVTWDENVVVTGSPEIALTIGSTTRQATYLSGSGGATLTFQYTVQAGDNDSDGIAFSSTVISLNGGTIRDAATNSAALDFTGVAPIMTSVLVDTTSPSITGVNAPANGTYGVGQNLDFTVTWDENVVVTGSPQIGLTIASTTRQATYLSGSGGATLTFRYTIQAGDDDLGGIDFQSTIIGLNGGSIADAATNNAGLDFTAFAPTLAGVLTDATAPSITAANAPANGTYGIGQSLNFTVTWDENVVVTGSPEITIVVGATPRQAVYASGSGGPTLTFTYAVQAGDDDTGGIAFQSTAINLNGGTIVDAGGNSAALDFTSFTPTLTGVLTDGTLPTITGATVGAATAFIDVTFSEGVYKADGTSPLDQNDFSLIFTAGTGGATNITIAGVQKVGGGALTGGETTIQITLTVAGTVNGTETIEVKPAGAASIHDLGKNAMSATQTTGPKSAVP